ncbi:DUF885 domain-containing protein [Foetidibacter luteolus]|uniref:DUF885 domain-containing protein n=1 Tax=Foetidibacter luteolus TaxID=2608880 RepID=UPI00129BBD4B|nr:DUF885 domain-containing protein [Foetidibacter luteolus]
MKKVILVFLSATLLFACKLSSDNQQGEANTELAAMLSNYYEESLQLFPLSATYQGDNRYNSLLPVEFTESYRAKLKDFYSRYLNLLSKFDRSKLNEQDKISYDVFKHDNELSLESLGFQDNYIPFQQFYALPLSLGQLGSGDGAQPFKTVKDYEDWLKRATAFSAWADSAIVYFRKGIAANYVLPKSLVVKMIPQMQAMVVDSAAKSLFYGPVTKMPASFTQADKQRLTQAYTQLILQQLVPAYKKLADFLQTEYLPKSRPTSGLGSLPGGKKYYEFLVRQQTTTNKTPDEIHTTGLNEVKRIRGQMDSVKNAVGFKGDLNAFFEFMRNDKQFTPFKTPEEVLNAFRSIQAKIQPHLATMFGHVPKTKFEIRQTEAFRAASASAEYNQGTADGSRPGIFYVPILDATKFNTTSGMESLFLHEAIPGHHYQISLQQEDTTLPKFRRYGGHNAYVEGWALYCESLGRELGLYTDPYQYMGALGDEMHRAIRLVVDVAIHNKGMTREEAIQYMMDNEAISEQSATAEIERYMAIPGQALGYKIGALKIRELRNKYQQQLADKFKLAAFHDEFLKDGSMPLDVVEQKMDRWANRAK